MRQQRIEGDLLMEIYLGPIGECSYNQFGPIVGGTVTSCWANVFRS